MLIPPQTTFTFRCTEHQESLRGEPELVHPNDKATLVWVFDTSEMYCPVGESNINNCADKWEVRA